MRFDLADTFVAMLQEWFEELRVQAPRAGLERNLFLQRADLADAARLIRDVDCSLFALGPLHGAAYAAERIEVVIDGRNAELDRL